MIDFSKYLHYDSIRGVLIWTLGKRAGLVAGNKRMDGVIDVKVYGVLYKAHRIIWEMRYGPIPEGMVVDHRDGNKSNNRLDNLRLATHAQNIHNQRAFNSLGVKGVYRNRSSFASKIMVNKNFIYLGSFHTKGLAALAYAKASIRHHGSFSIFMSAPKKATIKLS